MTSSDQLDLDQHYVAVIVLRRGREELGGAWMSSACESLSLHMLYTRIKWLIWFECSFSRNLADINVS